jgi:hypothetical protein
MKLPALSLLLVALSPVLAQDQPQPGGWQVAPPDGLMAPSDSAPAPAMVPQVEGPDPRGAVAAMMAIDPKYTEGVVVVTARGGTPVPKEWTVIARDTDDLGTLHKITVVNGNVLSDSLSLNTYESFRQDVNIDPQQVQVDSGAAFLIAQPIAAANQQIIGHADYALTVRGKDSVPIWTINCFGMNGFFIGKVVLLATDGTVVETPGFKNQPTGQ